MGRGSWVVSRAGRRWQAARPRAPKGGGRALQLGACSRDAGGVYVARASLAGTGFPGPFSLSTGTPVYSDTIA